MQAELERRPGLVVLRIGGDLRLWGRAEAEQQLLETVRSGAEEPTAQLVLNLRGVSNIDTRGIRGLVPVLVACSQRKIALKVILPAGVAGEALRRVRIFEPWPEFQDEEAATQARV